MNDKQKYFKASRGDPYIYQYLNGKEYTFMTKVS